ncbi:MAG TPA: hypothetical protein VGL56_19170 [Fimbriimonadaceae bacterium]|jgi:hypothetical protein
MRNSNITVLEGPLELDVIGVSVANSDILPQLNGHRASFRTATNDHAAVVEPTEAPSNKLPHRLPLIKPL